MSDPQMRHRHDVFSLRIASELPLPELSPASSEGGHDVEIRVGSVPVREGAVAGYSVFPDGSLLQIPDVGRYWISGGDSIIVEPLASASDRNVRLFLLGSAFGALLHQRALLPIHANAVEVEGRAILFAGHSGAGKSTMAAWFHDRGFRILSDDVCVIKADGHSQPIAHSGIPRLRLWREALEASGRTSEAFQLSADRTDKFDVPVQAKAISRSLPLGQIYLLGKAEGSEQAGCIERLKGVEAVDALVDNTYRGAYLQMIGGTRQHLFSCLELVRNVPVFRARRRWGYDAFDREARAIEDHIRQTLDVPPAERFA